MSTKSREVIWGGRIMGAKIRAQGARENAEQAVREADRAVPKPGPSAWRATEALPNPLRLSGSASMAALAGWRSSAAAARHAQACPSTLSADLKIRRYGSFKLTETRQIAPYKWVHPSEDR